jgi:hypothetical protein
MSATAALAWTKVCRQRLKMIAAHQPVRSPPTRRPHAKSRTAVNAAATADGNRAANSFSPKAR